MNKKKKPDYYSEAVVILKDLKILYPNYNLGRHLATALEEYVDVWGVSDKELSYALVKYKAQLQLDSPHAKEDIDDIIKGGMDFTNLISPEEGEDFIDGQHY